MFLFKTNGKMLHNGLIIKKNIFKPNKNVLLKFCNWVMLSIYSLNFRISIRFYVLILVLNKARDIF